MCSCLHCLLSLRTQSIWISDARSPWLILVSPIQTCRFALTVISRYKLLLYFQRFQCLVQPTSCSFASCVSSLFHSSFLPLIWNDSFTGVWMILHFILMSVRVECRKDLRACDYVHIVKVGCGPVWVSAILALGSFLSHWDSWHLFRSTQINLVWCVNGMLRI